MGSSSSKFRKHLQSGDEYAAMQLFTSNSDLHKGLDPNSSYGDNHSHNTPMHYVARHAMKSLLRIFLVELGGNPNKKNSHNETVLHCLCAVEKGLSHVQQQKRVDCLILILQWSGPTLQDGRVEKADLGATDEKENTALHYSAMSGIHRCVELLVSHGAPLFVENILKETPCDCAEKAGNSEIALYLESKMVFSNDDQNVEEMDVLLNQMESDEGYSGLRAQDLQEAKDQLLVETSDMLHVPLFTAEALLRNHEWSRETLLESWIKDAIACCEKCGVTPPITLYNDRGIAPVIDAVKRTVDHDLGSPSIGFCPSLPDAMCDICTGSISTAEPPVLMSCEHHFCRSCWKMYLSGKIIEGEAHNITCPGYQCNRLVPVDIIETLVDRDMARRYLQFDIKAFVESNPSIKWCPYPGCGRAVRLPDADNLLSPTFRASKSAQSPSDTSHAVDCGNGHTFCWECLGEAHEPASCENWKNWHQKIAEVKPEELTGTDEETENSANCLWLVTNSKPCSNCKSPIQKNEGCNHMKCSKCKHDFCWVCLEPWKKHSTATGGYFRCNRYEVVKKVEEHQDMLKSEAEAKNKKMQELNRFVHYYSRFKNHENSYKLEVPLFSTAKEKMMVLAKAVTDHDSANQETKFVQDAVTQLLKARHVLKCSYVYGYYLEETGYKKPIFEFMQTELEECTETLSEMVARPYLRTPRTKIVQTAHLVQRKRHEFVMAIAKGLVPPDTSPASRKKRKMFSVEIDEDTKKALIASLQDDPANLWVKDPSGRHKNVSALLDWPEESDESDSEDVSPSKFSASVPKPPDGIDMNQVDLDIPGLIVTERSWEMGCDEDDAVLFLDDSQQGSSGKCARNGCFHQCARNPRTGELHEHCSMKCMHLDRLENEQGIDLNSQSNADYFTDYHMDLLRALEMSRLQFLREMGSLHPGTGERSTRSPLPSPRLSPSQSQSGPRHESTSSDVDLQGSQCLTLIEPLPPPPPPQGRNRIASASLAYPQSSVSQQPGHDDLYAVSNDAELQRALEISRLSLQEEERELCLAIELSMKDTGTMSSGSTLKSVSQPQLDYFVPTSSAPPGWLSQSRTSEDLLKQTKTDSSVVTTSMPSSIATDSSAATAQVACVSSTTVWATRCHQNGAMTNVRTAESTSDSKTKSSFTSTESHECTRKSLMPSAKANRFGIIKDISVANILTTDHDKTRDFAGKDFSQMFGKHSIPGEMEIENVFEPRPPHPELSPVLSASHEKCIFTQNETVSMVDPWQQMPSTRDYRMGKLPRPQFRSWKEGARSYNRHCHCSVGNFCSYCREPDTEDGVRSAGEPARRKSSQGLEFTTGGGGGGFASKSSPGKDGSMSTGRVPLQDCLDPADIIISSEILESLLQGAEGYDSSKCPGRTYSAAEEMTGVSDDTVDEMLPLPPPPPPLSDELVAESGVVQDGISPDSLDPSFVGHDLDADGDKDAVFV